MISPEPIKEIETTDFTDYTDKNLKLVNG